MGLDLLSWLTGGSSGAGMPPVQQTGADAPPPAQPPLNFQRPEFAQPRPPQVDPSTSDIAGGMTGAGPARFAQGGDPMGSAPNGPGLPPPPTPLPMARPDGAPGPAAAIPTATPRGPITMNEPLPNAGPPGPLGPGLGVGAPPPGGGNPDQRSSLLSRAFGLDNNSGRTIANSLGAGLTAAGNSAGKSPFQAFASGAGASIEGGEKTNKTIDEEQSRYLRNAIAAMQAGNTAEANKSLIELRIAQTKKAQQEALDLANGTGGSKANVSNSRQQLILRADKQALGEAQVSANGVKQALTAAGGNLDDPIYKKALAEHNALLETIKQKKYQELGVTAKEVEKLGKQPGMSSENPAQPKTLADLQKLPVGAYYIPKAGWKGEPLVKLSPEELAAKKAAASGTPAGGAAASAAPAAAGSASNANARLTDPEAAEADSADSEGEAE